jgi:hypothetical protein
MEIDGLKSQMFEVFTILRMAKNRDGKIAKNRTISDVMPLTFCQHYVPN